MDYHANKESYISLHLGTEIGSSGFQKVVEHIKSENAKRNSKSPQQRIDNQRDPLSVLLFVFYVDDETFYTQELIKLIAEQAQASVGICIPTDRDNKGYNTDTLYVYDSNGELIIDSKIKMQTDSTKMCNRISARFKKDSHAHDINDDIQMNRMPDLKYTHLSRDLQARVDHEQGIQIQEQSDYIQNTDQSRKNLHRSSDFQSLRSSDAPFVGTNPFLDLENNDHEGSSSPQNEGSLLQENGRRFLKQNGNQESQINGKDSSRAYVAPIRRSQTEGLLSKTKDQLQKTRSWMNQHSESSTSSDDEDIYPLMTLRSPSKSLLKRSNTDGNFEINYDLDQKPNERLREGLLRKRPQRVNNLMINRNKNKTQQRDDQTHDMSPSFNRSNVNISHTLSLANLVENEENHELEWDDNDVHTLQVQKILSNINDANEEDRQATIYKVLQEVLHAPNPVMKSSNTFNWDTRGYQESIPNGMSHSFTEPNNFESNKDLSINTKATTKRVIYSQGSESHDDENSDLSDDEHKSQSHKEEQTYHQSESDHTDSQSDLVSFDTSCDSGKYELATNLMTPSSHNYRLLDLDSVDNQDDKVSNRGESPQPGSHLNIRNTNTNLRNLKRLSKSDSALNSNMNDSQELNTRTISTIRTNNTVERGTMQRRDFSTQTEGMTDSQELNTRTISTIRTKNTEERATSPLEVRRSDFATQTEDKSTTDLPTSTNRGHARIVIPQSNEVNNRASQVKVPTSLPNELYRMPAQNVSLSRRHKVNNPKSHREKMSSKQSAVPFGTSSKDRSAWLSGPTHY